MGDGLLIPVSYAYASSYANDDSLERLASKCVNLFWDQGRGEIICLDNGVVIGERMPSPLAVHNRTRKADRPVGKKARGETKHGLIVTYGNIKPSLARKILTMYEDGEPVKEIAKRLGIPVGMIYDVVKANTRMRRGTHKRYRRLSKKELEEILEELRSGASINSVAKKHGRSTSHIWLIAKKHGIKVTERKKRKQTAELRALK